jgi:hypothetical protein
VADAFFTFTNGGALFIAVVIALFLFPALARPS